jgi:hypothetical protein
VDALPSTIEFPKAHISLFLKIGSPAQHLRAISPLMRHHQSMSRISACKHKIRQSLWLAKIVELRSLRYGEETRLAIPSAMHVVRVCLTVLPLEILIVNRSILQTPWCSPAGDDEEVSNQAPKTCRTCRARLTSVWNRCRK